MIRIYTLLIICSIYHLCAFDQRPWIDEPYLFDLRPSFSLSYFPSVANANQLDFHSLNEDININLGVATMSGCDIQAEIEAFNSRMKVFNVESIGVQVRKLLFDDIEGDLFSWIIGLNYRVVPHYRLEDVAMPYHYVSNVEAVTSMGKEFSKGPYWIYHIYSMLAAGIANKGSPWMKVDFYGEGLIQDRHEWDVFLKTYFGFGNKNIININKFDGYYDVAHHSIDLGAGYRYHFVLYGSLGINALYRLYAHAYPSHLFAVTIDYCFPFSVF
ncbi:MAG: hypothetical protein HY860_04475 [Chlamydiales bacterium]|nr:hypothetical protein [Chlamydiales bacterium]